MKRVEHRVFSFPDLLELVLKMRGTPDGSRGKEGLFLRALGVVLC